MDFFHPQYGCVWFNDVWWSWMFKPLGLMWILGEWRAPNRQPTECFKRGTPSGPLVSAPSRHSGECPAAVPLAPLVGIPNNDCCSTLCSNHPSWLISGYEKPKENSWNHENIQKPAPPCAPPALLCCYRRPSAARWRPCARCPHSCTAHPPAPHRRRRAPGPPGRGRPPRSPGSPRPSAARRPPTSGSGQGPGRCTPGGHRAQRSSWEAAQRGLKEKI